MVDINGLPVRLALTGGEAHDNRLAAKLLSRLKSGTMQPPSQLVGADKFLASPIRVVVFFGRLTSRRRPRPDKVDAYFVTASKAALNRSPVKSPAATTSMIASSSVISVRLPFRAHRIGATGKSRPVASQGRVGALRRGVQAAAVDYR
jgi:hypothetical protein